MLTLYHAPMSRSTSMLVLIEEMGITDQVDIVEVSLARMDGSGGADPQNPHPEGKVPLLVDGETTVRERGAIITYLTDKFPESGMGRPVGHPERGAFLSWLFYYQGVMEPVLVLDWAKIEHPIITRTFRDLDAVFERLSEALEGQDYILGGGYSAVDLLLSSPFHWLPDAAPTDTRIKDWIERCAARPALKAITEREVAQMPQS